MKKVICDIKKKILLCALLVIISSILISCRKNDATKEVTNELVELRNQNQSLNILIEEKNKHIKDIEEQIKEDVNKETVDIMKSEHFKISPKRLTHLIGNVNVVEDAKIKLYPSKSAPSVGKIEKNSSKNVIVYQTVVNQCNEYWVLINSGVAGLDGIGYVPINVLDRDLSQFEKSEELGITRIEDVGLGDCIYDFIGKFGESYLINVDMYGDWLIYTDLNGINLNDHILLDKDPYCTVLYDSGSKRIRSIRIDKSGYRLDSGFQVGDSIKDVINFYNNYPMEVDGYIYTFQISESEYLSVHSTSDNTDLNKDSKVKRIILEEKGF